MWRWRRIMPEVVEVTLYIVAPMFMLAVVFGIIGFVDSRGGYDYDAD